MAEPQTLEEAWGWLVTEHNTPGGKNDHVLDAARALAKAAVDESLGPLRYGRAVESRDELTARMRNVGIAMRRRIKELGW